MIHATVDGSYRKERGDRKVRVGIIDTGVDENHPDIAPNFSRSLSRNFTVDIPFDPISEANRRPCTDEPDGSCNDANDVDENRTARTWRARSARRSTASGWPALLLRSRSSTSAEGRTPATSSCSRASTPSRTRVTTGSTWST